MERQHRKSLREPDETVRFEGITEDIVEIAGFTVGRTVQQPGWRWSETDPRSKTEGVWCQAHHVGVVLSGRWGADLPDGTTLEWGPDDVFDCPPGHDGFTIGDEPCVQIEWVGLRAFTAPMTTFGDRQLVALLFTDVVDSTVNAIGRGDPAWHDLLAEHYALARGELERTHGREIAVTGDGLLAVFDSPAQALRCAAAIRDATAQQALQIRAGVHVGEVSIVGDSVQGIAVHEAARVMAAAGPGEIYVSEIGRTLAASAGLVFVDRGTHELKGLDGPRTLFAYEGDG